MQTYHGMCKRLTFEDYEKQGSSVRHNRNSTNRSCTNTISVIPETPFNMENLHASNTLVIRTSDVMHSIPSLADNISCNYLLGVNSCRQSKETSTAMDLRPSGIDLHLNSIKNSGKTCNYCNMLMPTEDLCSIGMSFFKDSCETSSQDLKNLVPLVQQISNNGDSLFHSSRDSLFCSVGQFTNERHQKLPDSVGFHSLNEGKSLGKCVESNLSDHHIIPCNRKSSPFEGSNKSDDSAQTNPREKRQVGIILNLYSRKKKALEDGGQKPCRCKRSKCLKLYCDCFAIGNFCNEACSCLDCSNKIQNEETVYSSRKQILSRNPLSFSSKLVVHANNPSKSTDIWDITPPSTRHKRG
ncbi:CRC domain-containing protein TSO1 [Apostasia shenzhenica]|uniref:CRC domain-containing protein TSO1 n=1 Tax=Apostasia shenzhenica TaxID=1088818 RepID=A0A2I0B9W8_9ASPA|nr:CRC domain-containing protein TSO1 [Apostasia shenzhenica]